MDFFLVEGGSCSYDDEIIGDIEAPLRYNNLVKQMVPKEQPSLDTNFSVNNRMYHIAPSSLHGLELFYIDGIIVKYNIVNKLMDCVRPYYYYAIACG